MDFLRRCWRRLRGWHWLVQLVVAGGLIVGLVALGYKIADIWAFWDDAPDRGALVVKQDVFGDHISRIVYLDQGKAGQNWKPQDSLWFDNVTQGSDLLPYDFFLVLKQADGKHLFRSDENMNGRYRYLPRHQTYNNPDALPIGLVKDTFHGKAFMGFTCAACHTNQINYKNTGMRIDGAPAMADMDTFLTDLGTALRRAQVKGPIHDAFVKDVLALGRYGSAKDVETDLDAYALRLTAYRVINKSYTSYGFARLDAFGRIYNQVLQYVANAGDIELVLNEIVQDCKPKYCPISQADLDKSGVPALLKELKKKAVLVGADRDRIIGQLVTGLSLKQALYFRNRMFNSPDAPVSYPFIWDIPQHDYVQWNGIAANSGLGPIGRNTGEVMGVFGTMDWSRSDHWTLAGVFAGQGLLNGHPIDYASSVDVHNLALIEDKLKSLHSPLWPEDILPKLDRQKVAQGRIVFDQYCARCHAPIDRTAASRRVVAHMSSLKNIKTDGQMALNGVGYQGYSGILRNTYVEVGPGGLLLDRRTPVAALLTKSARGVVATPDSDKWPLRRFFEWLYDVIFSLRNNDIQSSMKSGDYDPDTTQAPLASDVAYKGRSLNGIWATAPYLHNGSVPTLYDLLLPAETRPDDPPGMAHRPTQFTLGSREFDPVQVGFMPTRMQGATADDPCPIKHPPEAVPCFVFRTAKLGNSNGGHEYGTRDTPVLNPDGTVAKNADGTDKILPALSERQRWDLVEYLKSL